MKNDLRFCLVGRGSIGTRHVKNLKSLSFRNIVAYSESFVENEKASKDKIGIKIYNSLEDIKKFGPDAFIIANPTSKHVKTAMMASDLGSHVFMEKPLSNNLEGVKELEQGLIKKKLTFFQANNFRYHPALIETKRLIEANKLGHIYFARIMAGQYLPDWHPDEDYRYSYSAREELGGGVVLTLQHEIDYAYWLFGSFKSIKSYVKKISDLNIDVEDIALVIIETESGELIEIHVDYLQRPSKRTVHIQGSKGSIDYKFGDRYLRFYEFKERSYKNIIDLSGYDNNQMYIDEMKHFIKCITGKEKTKSDIKDAIYVLETCLKIKEELN